MVHRGMKTIILLTYVLDFPQIFFHKMLLPIREFIIGPFKNI